MLDLKLMLRCVLMTVCIVPQAVANEGLTIDFDASESAAFSVRGETQQREGVEGDCVALDGESVVSLSSDFKTLAERSFTLSVWLNPYSLNRGQQIVAAKNRYSLNEREWSLMVDADGHIRLYVRQNGWRTIDGPVPELGRWCRLTFVLNSDNAALFVNGKHCGSLQLDHPVAGTAAPLTLGGIDDGGRTRQTLLGAIDELQLLPRSLTAEEIVESYRPVSRMHKLPKLEKPFALWDESVPLLAAKTLPELQDVAFHVIKKWNQPVDGYTFLHGVALQWHGGRLFASIGHNKGAENTVTEEAQYRVSDDGGKTWGPLKVIDAGEEENLAVSHGVFLSHKEKLWAFHGAYYGHMDRIHTRAYSFDEATESWTAHGVVLESGFWPMNQPVRMSDGNWIMPGLLGKRYSSNDVFPAAVAISHGDDFSKWDLVRIPVQKRVKRMWGESSLFVDGNRVVNIARYGGAAVALAATSEDFGRTWSPSSRTNLPMTTSKPAAGVLSNGQRYLVCTTTSDTGGQRSPLTIAVSRPHENVFSKVFVIRRSAHFEGQPGESAERLSLSYPYAIEHDGKLYVGYSNNGGRRANLNSAELAVVPIRSLAVDAAVQR